MTSLTTTSLAALTTSILVLSVLSGATLALGHSTPSVAGPSESSIHVTGADVPAAASVSPHVASSGPYMIAAHSPAVTQAIQAASSTPRALLPSLWGITINPDGSVSGTGASHVTSIQDVYYNFTADYSGSILDERNGSNVNGNSWDFSNTTGNPVDLEVLNASNVQVHDFYLYSGFTSIQILGSTNVTAYELNDTEEPDDSATFGGSEYGAAVYDSSWVSLQSDDLNGSFDAVLLLDSQDLTIDGGIMSGGSSANGDGIYASGVTDLNMDYVYIFSAYAGIYVSASYEVIDAETSVRPYNVEYGAVYLDSEEVGSEGSNFSASFLYGLYFDNDMYVVVYGVNGSAPLEGDGLFVGDSIDLTVQSSLFYFAQGSLESAGIALAGDSCYDDYCEIADSTVQLNAIGVLMTDCAEISVEYSSVEFNEWNLAVLGSSSGEVEYSNLSYAGWFIEEGVGVLATNDSYFEFNHDTITDGSGVAGAYLFEDSDVEMESDILANNTNAGVLVGANEQLSVQSSDVSNEYYVGSPTVGIGINTSTDVYIDGNNVSNDDVGIEDRAVAEYGEFDSNDIGSDGIGVVVQNGSDFYVDYNFLGAGLFPDAQGIEILGGFDGIVLDNQLGGSTSDGVVVNAGNGMYIAGNNVSGNQFGILLDDSIACEIWGNDGNATTVVSFYSLDSSGSEIMSNYATLASIGVDVDGGYGSWIEDNNLTGATTVAAVVLEAQGTFVSGNILTDATTGLVVSDSVSTTVVLNQFVGNPTSIAIESDVSTLVYQNDFVGIGIHGWEIDDDVSLWWNASYPLGGNYWSNDTPTADTESGPGQNLSGSDGINDTPFVQGQGAVVDDYPLIHPIAAAPPVLAFTETGLPSYMQWRLLINVTYAGTPTLHTSTYGYTYPDGVSSVALSLAAGAIGTFEYTAAPISGWVATPSSGSGSTPQGTLSTTIVYTPFPYTVSFTATGIAAGTSWNVMVNGHTYTSTTLWDNVSLGNGTYTWTATSSAAPSVNGNVTVHTAAASVTVAFHPPQYTVVFTQAGLPTGATWSVDFNGVPMTSSGSEIVFTASNGSYTYTVTNSGTSTPSSASGPVVVNGAGQGIVVVFSSPTTSTPPGTFAVVFTETGLASGASWTVSLNGVPQTATGDAISFAEKNGTFAYTVTSTGTVVPNPASGSVTVVGSAVGTAIAFGTSGGTTTTPSGSNTGISSTDLYAVIAVAVILGILAAIGWTRGGKGSSSGAAPNTPPPSSWNGPNAPAGPGAPPPGSAGGSPPAWQLSASRFAPGRAAW
ncbi:MAG: hypothetical protein L3K03_05310 [Thermoplasmata archaeon]|nr:hypothetical protein [Thermoplasmata archaeon]